MFDWTASKIDAANYCTMRFYLRYVDPRKPKSLMLPVYAKGSLLHSSIEHFWNKFGEPEEIKRNKNGKITSKKKYSNPQEFQKYLDGKWMQRLIGNMESERSIDWQFEEQPWVIRSQLEKLAEPLFNQLISQEKPLHIEFPFKFTLGNKKFTGRIDEIRIEEGYVLIRDYKSGKPWLDETKLKGDPQLTFYNAGLNMLLKQHDELRNYFIQKGANEEFLTFDKGIINPNFKQEFFMIEALPRIEHPENFPMMKDIPNLRLSAQRKEAHFSELLKMVEGVFSSVSSGKVYPERGRKCENCDMKIVCDKELEMSGSGYMLGKNNQYHLSFDIPDYLKPDNLTHDSFGLSSFGTQEKQDKKKKQKNPRQLKLRLRVSKL